MSPEIPPKGYHVLAAWVRETGRKLFGEVWTGHEGEAVERAFPASSDDVLAVIDALRGNVEHAPLPDDGPALASPPRSLANPHFGQPRLAPRRTASPQQWAEAQAACDQANEGPRAALARLADVEKHCAEQLIWGEAVAVAGHALEPIAATWWGDDWKAKLRHGKMDGKAIFVRELGSQEEETATIPKQSRRAQPKRSAAEAALRKLYPEGLPAKEQLPDVHLVKAVQEELGRGMTVDRSTILRAAERRGD